MFFHSHVRNHVRDTTSGFEEYINRKAKGVVSITYYKARFSICSRIFFFYDATTSVHLSETKLWLLTENDKEGIHVRIQMKYDKRFSWIKHKTRGEMEAGG